MNKKVLMLVPMAALFLASCGNQPAKWEEIEYSKVSAIVEDANAHNTINVPTSMRIYYKGNKATLLGQEYKNIGNVFEYDYNKKYEYINQKLLTPAAPMPERYYVSKDNKLWLLTYTGEEKRKEAYDYPSPIQPFVSFCAHDAWYQLTAPFEETGLFSYVSMLEGFKTAIEGGSAEGEVDYKFYTHGDLSLKFTYAYSGLKFKIPGAPDVAYSGSQEFVMEKGRMKYSKSEGSTLTAMLMDTESHATLLYEYDCSVSIPKEANPDTWCE